MKNYGETNFITGMRAFAAMAIVLIHSGGGGLRSLGTTASEFVDFCPQGVSVFFVISGFSVAVSFYSSQSYFHYLNKRIWRIAPLYYFWIAATILLGFVAQSKSESFNAPPDFWNILAHLTFLSSFNYRYADSIIGVEWSIAVEVFWYFLLPLMLLASRFMGIPLLAGAYYLYSYLDQHTTSLPVDPDYAAYAMNYLPFKYVLSYALGISAFEVRKHIKHNGLMGDLAFVFCLLVILVYVPFRRHFPIDLQDKYVFSSLLAFTAIVFGSAESRLFRWFFENRAAQFLGMISYGLYLCHFPIIRMLGNSGIAVNETAHFLIVSGTSIIVAWATYILIEVPANRVVGPRFFSAFSQKDKLPA
ncbi:MAG TPA: acyltransferase [Ensifer sp.]|nr:acyltransferase [Ensifer sp.]